LLCAFWATAHQPLCRGSQLGRVFNSFLASEGTGYSLIGDHCGERCDLALSVTELSQLLGFIDDRWPTVYRPNPFSGIRPFGVSLSMGASMRRVSVALVSAICVIAFTHMASATDLNKPARPQLCANCFLISSINIHTHFTDDIGRVTSDRVGRVR
jgi:hypothetical protein